MSTVSAPCRLEWGSSRWFAAGLIVLGALAAIAAATSELSWLISFPLALCALIWAGFLAVRELRRRPHSVVIPGRGKEVCIDAAAVSAFALRWRGPLVFASWRDDRGRRHQLQGWPDNLDAASRRELRLAMGARAAARTSRSMAP